MKIIKKILRFRIATSIRRGRRSGRNIQQINKTSVHRKRHNIGGNMEDKYINKILNFADENINTAKELVINKEQAKKIVKELQEDYTPNAIIKLKIAELKEKYNQIVNEINNQEVIDQLIDFEKVSAKLEMCEELLEKR